MCLAIHLDTQRTGLVDRPMKYVAKMCPITRAIAVEWWTTISWTRATQRWQLSCLLGHTLWVVTQTLRLVLLRHSAMHIRLLTLDVGLTNPIWCPKPTTMIIPSLLMINIMIARLLCCNGLQGLILLLSQFKQKAKPCLLIVIKANGSLFSLVTRVLTFASQLPILPRLMSSLHFLKVKYLPMKNSAAFQMVSKEFLLMIRKTKI